jgi:hypothetical protein
MGSSAQNQKATTTQTVTNTTSTNVVISKGADAAALATALGGELNTALATLAAGYAPNGQLAMQAAAQSGVGEVSGLAAPAAPAGGAGAVSYSPLLLAGAALAAFLLLRKV